MVGGSGAPSGSARTRSMSGRFSKTWRKARNSVAIEGVMAPWIGAASSELRRPSFRRRDTLSQVLGEQRCSRLWEGREVSSRYSSFQRRKAATTGWKPPCWIAQGTNDLGSGETVRTAVKRETKGARKAPTPARSSARLVHATIATL